MSKKEFRKDIETKLDTAFGHLANSADKKFRKIIKKASLLLTEALYITEPKNKPVKTKKAKSKEKTSPTKIKSPKEKDTAKVSKPVAVKKVVKKAAKKTEPKKKSQPK